MVNAEKMCTSERYKNTDAYTQSALMRTKIEVVFGSKAEQALNNHAVCNKSGQFSTLKHT